MEALSGETAIRKHEIEAASASLDTVNTLYIGGGTPSVLPLSVFSAIVSALQSAGHKGTYDEFTVEVNPDDIVEKGEAYVEGLLELGVNRISINPQTMIDSVLAACGRPHTAQDVVRCYQQAMEAGFEDVNMDLIAGLPTDTYAGFCRSLDAVASLSASNITVHTLALKKGADLFETQSGLPSGEEVAKMVAYANEQLTDKHYKPYYLYRQKYMSGSFENVGWSRDDLDCLYNIYMMEEVHTILSLGGGGMNKVNFPDGKLQRFHNPKFPEQYIEMIEDVCKQKEEMFALMKGSV